MAGNGDPRRVEDLLAEAERTWQAKQAQMAEAIRALHARLAEMPDVRDAPASGTVRDFAPDGVQCPCGASRLVVQRWVTVNGLRHRMETRCLACRVQRTWDWPSRQWLEDGG